MTIKSQDPEVEGALEYLRDGGLGEVIGITVVARSLGHANLELNADVCMALCQLADQAIKASKAPRILN